VLSVFGDESHDETKQRVFAVAGLLGTPEEWDDLEIRWVKRTGGRVFHAAECESDKGEFSTTSHKENQELYRDLTKLIADTKMLGFGAGIDLAGFNEAFPDAPQDQPYFMCFVRVVIECAWAGYVSIPRQKVKFTFDNRPDSQHYAGSLYGYMATLPEWKVRPFLHNEISFACRKTVPIQAADLLARETMKHLDNQIGPVKRPMRKSMEALARTKRFRFIYHMKSFLEELRKHANGLLGDEDGYSEWLSQNKLQDNNPNRLRYLIQTEAEQRAKKAKT